MILQRWSLLEDCKLICTKINCVHMSAEISSDLDARGVRKDPLQVRKAVTKALVDMGMVPILPRLTSMSPPQYLTVMVDGCVVGHMLTTSIPDVVAHFRHLKVADSPEVRGHYLPESSWSCFIISIFPFSCQKLAVAFWITLIACISYRFLPTWRLLIFHVRQQDRIQGCLWQLVLHDYCGQWSSFSMTMFWN